MTHFLKNLKHEQVELSASPDVIDVLNRDGSRIVHQVEGETGNRVTLVGDPHLHVEEVRLKRVLDKRRKLW